MDEFINEILEAIKIDNVNFLDEKIKSKELDLNLKINGLTLLMHAAKDEAIKILTMLIKIYRVNVNIVSDYYDDTNEKNIIDYRGKTALIFACEKGNYECTYQLIYNGACVYFQDAQEKYAIDYWLSNAKNNTTSDIKFILKKLSGFKNLGAKEGNFEQAIMHFKGKRLTDVIRVLCECGCDVNNTKNKTALHWLCENDIGDETITDTIDVLISFGADPYLKGSYISAYEYAISSKSRQKLAYYMRYSYENLK